MSMQPSSPSSSNAPKKMYKVLCPLERKGVPTYWMRVGTAFANRDDSLKVIIDAIPPPNHLSNRWELHVREFNAEDLRRREAYASNRGNDNHDRDLGGIGGIGGTPPSSRTVTSSAADDINF